MGRIQQVHTMLINRIDETKGEIIFYLYFNRIKGKMPQRLARQFNLTVIIFKKHERK